MSASCFFSTVNAQPNEARATVRLRSANELQKPARPARTRLGCSAQVTWNSNGQSLKYTLCGVTSPHRPETGIRGANKAHLTANDFVYSFVQLGTSGYSQLLASWGERSSFASLGMETHPAQPPTTLPDFLSLLADLAMDRPRQHPVTSQGDW